MTAMSPTGSNTTVSQAQQGILDKQDVALNKLQNLYTNNSATLPDIKAIKDVQYIKTPEGTEGFSFKVEVEVNGAKKMVTVVTGDPTIVQELLKPTSKDINNKFMEIMVMAKASAMNTKIYSYDPSKQEMRIGNFPFNVTTQKKDEDSHKNKEKQLEGEIQKKQDDIAKVPFYRPFKKGQLESELKDLNQQLENHKKKAHPLEAAQIAQLMGYG